MACDVTCRALVPIGKAYDTPVMRPATNDGAWELSLDMRAFAYFVLERQLMFMRYQFLDMVGGWRTTPPRQPHVSDAPSTTNKERSDVTS